MGRRPLLTNDQVLGAVHEWLLAHGVAPTIEELRQRLRLGSSRTVLRYLNALHDAGDIERLPGARGIRLRRAPGSGLKTQLVPIVGEAPAGPLMVAEENYEGWVRIPKTQLSPPSGRFFLLRVHGDSMNRAVVAGKRIENGDLVLVRQQSSADSGAVVVALIDGEATIKRLGRGDDYWLLKPESTNRRHHPIVVDERFRVQGAVVAVLKRGADLLDLH